MADRSLSFFTSIPRTSSNGPKDPVTGLNASTQNVDLTVNKYDPNDSLSVQSTEHKNVSYNIVQSMVADNQFINYMGNATTNDYRPYNPGADTLNELSLPQVIQWTQQNHPSLKLNWGQFAFLRDFGVYPANRLMVLRRFDTPVMHDLFKTTVTPIHTVATYYSFDDDFLQISFKEGWKKFDDSIIQVLTDIIGVDIASAGSLQGIGDTLGSTLSQSIISKIAQSLGYAVPDSSLYGDPNIIYESVIREIGNDDKVGGSLDADIKIKMRVNYTLKEINGIDAKAAMLDVIANATHMGTSNGKFLLTGKAIDAITPFLANFENGNINGMIDDILSGLSGLLETVKNKLSKTVGDIAKSPSPGAEILDNLTNFASDLIKLRFLRYKWKIQGAIGALGGSHTAPWHVTIGNPKNPWFSCGNMVVKNTRVSFGEGTELSYNDFPTEWTFEYDLENGRAMGANELTSLFNGGRGRVYDTIDSIQSVNISSNSTYKVPGQSSVNNGITPQNKQTGSAQISNNTNQVQTDQINDLSQSGIASTPFTLNNTDTDNNLPSL